jgi:hypothetical protein
MFLGLCIKKDDINHYCKPFFLNDTDENIFIAQIIRDVDFSLIINLNDIFELTVIIYPMKDSYYNANKNNLDPNTFKVLGKYNIIFDKIDNIIILDNFKKGVLKKRLDDNYDVDIEFSIILMENKVDYILSTPFVKGNKNYLNN